MSRRELYAAAGAALADWVLKNGGEQGAIEFLATFVASDESGSLWEFCNNEGLNWSILSMWIRKDEKRNLAFRTALTDRSAFRKERLLDGWWKTAALKVEKPPEHQDVHRAREALAKAEGMLGPNAGAVNISGEGVTVQIVRYAGPDAEAQEVSSAGDPAPV